VHELSIAAEVYRVARAAVGEDGTLRKVKVKVGELSAVEPALLGYAWDALVSGGVDSGAALEVEWCPARHVCTTCGVLPERSQGTWMRVCPRCGGPVRMEGGDELDVMSVSFDDGGGDGDRSGREAAHSPGERAGGRRAEDAVP
jgi:hydrogenase nickel incorporation protein HypA/HybF